MTRRMTALPFDPGKQTADCFFWRVAVGHEINVRIAICYHLADRAVNAAVADACLPCLFEVEHELLVALLGLDAFGDQISEGARLRGPTISGSGECLSYSVTQCQEKCFDTDTSLMAKGVQRLFVFSFHMSARSLRAWRRLSAAVNRSRFPTLISSNALPSPQTLHTKANSRAPSN